MRIIQRRVKADISGSTVTGRVQQAMKGFTHNDGTIIGKGGVELYFQSWTHPDPAAALVIVHGLGEHSGRYGNLIQALAGMNISIYAADHRGHGKSLGRKGHILSMSDYIDDLRIFVNIIRHDHERLPLVMLGHSMGGAIALKYALTFPDDLNALILSSPGLIPATEPPKALDRIARMMSRFFPSVSTSNQLNAAFISHDREVVRTYMDDPLVHDRISFRWYTEFRANSDECLERAGELKMPLLVFHGTDDRIVDFSGSIRVHESASSKDKTLKLFDGLYHETMNEVDHEREKVLDMVVSWIARHCRGLSGKGKQARPAKSSSKAKATRAKKPKRAPKQKKK
jgi:lysophospholipase